MSIVTSAAQAASMRPAYVCRNIPDLTGTLISELAESGVCGLGSKGSRLACSLLKPLPLKGSCVRWRVSKGVLLWFAANTEGYGIVGTQWAEVVRRMNAEIARGKRSADLGR